MHNTDTAQSLPAELACLAPVTSWKEAALSEHFVQFYAEDAVLLDAVGAYVGEALEAGAAAIVVATSAHLEALEQQWWARGLDLTAAHLRGQYIPFDAAETLSKLMLDDWPQARRFDNLIGAVVAKAEKYFPRVAAFGEMVGLLWQDGKHAAAIRLEELWNELAQRHRFQLFCAYPITAGGHSTEQSFRGICAAHARVIPAEGYCALSSPAERLMEVARLQQKAAELEREIQERRAIERNLARRDREFSDFLENAVEGMHKVGPDGRILWANKAMLQMLGYTENEYIGHAIADFHADPDVIADCFERLEAGETLINRPQRLRCKDGSIKHVLACSNVLWEDGQFIYSRCFFRDVTERKQLEEQLARKLEKLAEVDRRKDEFLAMLGHELRNPLAPIRNITEIIRRKGDTDPSCQPLYETLERQVQHMSRLLDDLLDVGRITQGKIQLQREPLELMTIVARAIETSRPLIDARRHRLQVSLPQEAMRVEGDLTRLVQMLANLVNNAAKYTPDGGVLSVSAQRQGEFLELSVKDNGVGIPPDILPRVFDLFTQADRTLARSEGGLGIGLTLVRSIAELHGGTVQALSAGPGAGSEFIVRLPALQDPAGAGDAAPAYESASGTRIPQGRRIVIVDDNRDSAESMALLLRLSGHDTAVATDGHTGLEVIHDLKPDVVLLDLGLPGMNGYEVAQQLREAGCSAVLIAITGYGQPEDRQRSRQAGFDHHLVKPVDPMALERLLHTL